MDFESLNLFGAPLTPVETYVYYDGPQTFAMRSNTLSIYYVFNAVEEDEELGEATFVIAAMTSAKFAAMRSGLIPFRDVFLDSPRTVQKLTWRFDDNVNEWVSLVEPLRFVPDEWLPTEDARLSLKTKTVRSYEPARLIHLSQAQNRTVFAVEVESERSNVTELPVKTTGLVQSAIHGEIDAIVHEFGSTRSLAVRELQVNFLEVQAASFVMVMAVDNSAALLEPTDLTGPVFKSFGDLIVAAGSGDEAAFLAELRKHNAKVRNRFRDLIRPLVSIRSGLALSTVIAHTQVLDRSGASPDAVRKALEIMDNVQPEVTHLDVRRGVLIGFNARTKRFELVDMASGQTYKGYMSADARDQADGFPVGSTSYVSARLRIETAFASDDEDSGAAYFIESIEETLK